LYLKRILEDILYFLLKYFKKVFYTTLDVVEYKLHITTSRQNSDDQN